MFNKLLQNKHENVKNVPLNIKGNAFKCFQDSIGHQCPAVLKGRLWILESDRCKSLMCHCFYHYYYDHPDEVVALLV